MYEQTNMNFKPVGAAPNIFSFLTKHIASMDLAKPIARRDETNLNLVRLMLKVWRFM